MIPTRTPIKTVKTKEPNLNTDFGWCVFKYMFIALLATNLLWAGFTVYLISKTSTDTTVTTEMTQDGTNNNQSITNG